MPVAYGLIEPADLSLPNLPPGLEGARIAHVSDLHVRRPRRLHNHMIDQLASLRVDLLVFTGDYMDREIHAQASFEVLRRLCERVRPTIGAFGVLGNHDTSDFRQAAEALPVHWLVNQVHCVADPPMEVFGLDAARHYQPDSVALALDHAPGDDAASDRRFRLLLSHYPKWIPTASDLGVDLMLAGHTHGGQIRLPTGHALFNSSDLPLRLTSGVLRHRNTLVAISRGLGEAAPYGLVGVRLFCPPHLPVYTLRRQPLPGLYCDGIEMIQRW